MQTLTPYSIRYDRPLQAKHDETERVISKVWNFTSVLLIYKLSLINLHVQSAAWIMIDQQVLWEKDISQNLGIITLLYDLEKLVNSYGLCNVYNRSSEENFV